MMREGSCPSSNSASSSMTIYFYSLLRRIQRGTWNIKIEKGAKRNEVKTLVNIQCEFRRSPRLSFNPARTPSLKTRKTRVPPLLRENENFYPSSSCAKCMIIVNHERRSHATKRETDGGIKEGEGRPAYRSRGPATTSCSHLARVMPATQWLVQVLSLRNPLLLRRVRLLACDAMTPTPPQCGASTERHEDSTYVRGTVVSKSEMCAASRLHGDKPRESTIRPEIDTHICRRESIDASCRGTVPCEFWKPEINRKIHSTTISIHVNIYCVRCAPQRASLNRESSTILIRHHLIFKADFIHLI